MSNESFLSQFEISADQRRPVALLSALVLLLIITYWNTLRVISVVWNKSGLLARMARAGVRRRAVVASTRTD